MTNDVADQPTQNPVERWADEISTAEKELKKFHERATVVVKKFIDERDLLTSTQRWFNIFYANTTILESALYAQLPKPTVSRRFTDYNDDVGRVAALIIERCVTQDLDDPTDLFDSTMRHCVQDRLVVGLAQAWLRLETDTEPISLPPTEGNNPKSESGDEEVGEPANESAKENESDESALQITAQRVVVDYIFWEDFIWSPCRVWEERRWVGRRAYMTREALIKRFGEVIGKEVPLNFSPRRSKDGLQGSTPLKDTVKKAVVYEIWDRMDREVIWYVQGYPKLLDTKSDPLRLKNFDPCPKPMFANISTSNTVPRPDYYMIQDQYIELDNINQRISQLLKACKVVGVYDQAAKSLQTLLTEGTDNILVPVESWTAFSEGGGLKGKIDWLPLEVVVQALIQLTQAREAIKGQIYELTGIADIVRGASKASETLGAQQIKAQFASIRIKKLQDEVARFAGDIMRIKAEIMVKHFQPEEIIRISNILVTGNDEYVRPAMELLASEGFEWRIQVGADTLAQADYAMEKQDRIDFMTSISKFMAQVGPMLEAAPESAPVMLGLLKWTVAGFRGARDIEGMLDKAVQGMQQQPEQPQEPSPEQLQAQQEQQKAQQEMQLAQQKAQLDATARQQELVMEQQRNQMEMAFEQQKQAMELQAETQRLALERQSQQMELLFERLLGELKVKNETELADVRLQSAESLADAKAKSQTQANARAN